MVLACYLCKYRDQQLANRSGSTAARKKRKLLPLTEEDPNESLVSGLEDNLPSNLEFVGGDELEGEAEEQDLEQEGQTVREIEEEA